MARFKLPPGWYRRTVTDLVRNTLPPQLGPLTADSAWAYVYAITMWAETHRGKDYLHVLESDKLKQKNGRRIADFAADYLATNLVPVDTSALVHAAATPRRTRRDGQGGRRRHE